MRWAARGCPALASTTTQHTFNRDAFVVTIVIAANSDQTRTICQALGESRTPSIEFNPCDGPDKEGAITRPTVQMSKLKTEGAMLAPSCTGRNLGCSPGQSRAGGWVSHPL